MFVTILLLVLILTLLYRWYGNRKEKFLIFKSMGISGPEPSVLLGNLSAMKDDGVHKILDDWSEEYGKTFGYFEGPKAVLVTSDVEILKHVMIKDFAKFHSRKNFPLVEEHDKFTDMFSAKGQNWKRLRSISSPSFSTKRMKEMSPLIHHSITQLLDVLESREKEGKPFDLFGEYQRMTLTVIASVAFGLEMNALKNPDDAFLHQVRKIFSISEQKSRNWAMTVFIPLALCFPDGFNKIWRYLVNYVNLPRTWFLNIAKRILEERMKSKSTRTDFLQLMLDAKEEDGPADLTMTADEDDSSVTAEAAAQTQRLTHKTDREIRTFAKKLTMPEMQAQCMLFLLAGYETTSTALAFTSYALALNPEVQKKLHAELDEHFPDKDCQPDYVSVQKLPYMDMVLSEVLRLYPIAQIATTREAVEDCTIGDLTIKKGMFVQAHMAAVHQDPELWGPEDPKEFVPERFLPERKAKRHMCAWMPFGIGPRNCVGMRFAFLESKLTLVRVLKNYVIERCEETKVPLPINKIAVTGPSEGVYVKLIKR